MSATAPPKDYDSIKVHPLTNKPDAAWKEIGKNLKIQDVPEAELIIDNLTDEFQVIILILCFNISR